MGRPEPQGAGAALGNEEHELLANHLLTGEMTLGPYAMQGRHLIPEPGPDLLIEQEISGLLQIEGIPVIGKLDLAHARGKVYGTTDILETQDPPNTIEVRDWKFMGKPGDARGNSYLETAQSLPLATPMVVYGNWALKRFAPAQVRLTHAYFFTKEKSARPRIATALVKPERLLEGLQRIGHTMRSMVSAVQAPSADEVPANTRNCDKFGGCPHREVCTAAVNSTLKQYFGESMSYLGMLPGAPQPAALPPMQTQAPVALQPDIQAQMAQLRAKEIASGAPMGFYDAWAHLSGNVAKHNRGFPSLAEDAAALVMASQGVVHQGALPGSGEFAAYNLGVQQVYDFAKELGWTPPHRPTLPALLPPEAATTQLAQLPPVVSGPQLPLPSGIGTSPVAVPVVATAAPAKRRGRPPKNQQPNPTGIGTSPSAGIRLYVNAITSDDSDDLGDYVDGLVTALNQQYSCIDPRCGNADGPLGFGRWKGVLAGMVRQAPPANGTYTCIRPDEITQVVVDTLRAIATEFVLGVG